MIAEILIQNSDEFLIDLNARDNNGATAFEKACQQGKKDIVEMMIDKRKEGVLVYKENAGSVKIDLTAVHLKDISHDFVLMEKTVYSRLEQLRRNGVSKILKEKWSLTMEMSNGRQTKKFSLI